jgi:hypothetical protein
MLSLLFIHTHSSIIITNSFISSWADGKSAEEGILAFLENHVCTTFCNCLKLGKGGKALDLKGKKKEENQPPSLDKILASRNHDAEEHARFFDSPNVSDDSDEVEIQIA